MITRIHKRGNSQGLGLIKALLSGVRRIPKSTRAVELDWGPRVVREVW